MSTFSLAIRLPLFSCSLMPPRAIRSRFSCIKLSPLAHARPTMLVGHPARLVLSLTAHQELPLQVGVGRHSVRNEALVQLPSHRSFPLFEAIKH